MQRVRCYECSRLYDYDEDGFCPRCGAFNQPEKTSSINAQGEIVRVDGIRENGHVNSFAHQELHAESRERRRSGLDRSVQRWKPEANATKARTDRTVKPKVAVKGQQKEKTSVAASVLKWLVYISIIYGISRFFM